MYLFCYYVKIDGANNNGLTKTKMYSFYLVIKKSTDSNENTLLDAQLTF